MDVSAKLKPGVTVAQAQADADVVVRRLATVYSDNYPKNFSVQIVSWVESLVGQFGKTLYTIAAAVALLLLIACGNVANMLLARGTAREKEMAIRSSLGASRSRIIAQLLAESLLLAAGGATLGCLFAYAGIQGMVALIPDGLIPREAQIRLNLPVLLFSLATAAATAIIFGLAPALATARKNLVEPLKDAGKGVSGGFRRGRLRNALVIAEVALSLILLSGAGLLIRSFIRLQTVDLGFRPDNILFARIPFPRGQYESAEEKQRFFRELLPRVQRLHGVAAATESTGLPPFGGPRSDIEIPGRPQSEKRQSVVQLVSEGYFQTLQLQVRRGRTLSESEVNAGRKLAVVNQTLVNRFLPGEDPIGKPIRVKLLETLPRGAVRDAVFEIVGVVSDAKNQGIQEPVLPEIYVPHSITGQFFRAVIVRTTVPPQTLLKDVQREVWAVDRSVALTDTGSLEEFLQRFTYAEPRFGLVLMAVFAGVGLVLVALGVFSVIAYTVSRQTHEIGVRMALGAGRGDVLLMVLRLGGKLLGPGVAIGLLGSLAATRAIAAQLWGVSPRDPLTLAVVAAVVAIAGFAACYFPARRARASIRSSRSATSERRGSEFAILSSMAPESLDTLDAVLAGLHTLAGHAGSVEDEQLRQKLTGTITGLRAAILTARGQVLQMQEQFEQLTAQSRQFRGEPASAPRSRTPRMKWGCYQFDDTEGLFCTACYDKRNRRVRTMRHNSANLICPNCRTLFPVR